MNLEYGAALPATSRKGEAFPVFGSNGEVGRHECALVDGPGIIVGRKGSAGEVSWSGTPFWPIDTTYYVASRGPEIRWLYWTLLRLPLRRMESSTGVPGLNRNDAYEFRISTPPLPEQRQIAAILDTIDDAIRKTEQIIAKLKQVKQGLLHDLLTCGVDHNGELRDPERHPEQFKDSPLGRIPRGWEAAPFRSYSTIERPYLKTGPFGSSLKQHHWVSDGIPVITIGALGEGEFISTELLHVSEKTAKALSSYVVMPGDIVFSRVADVGRSVVVEQAQRGWIMSSNLMWISLDQRRASPSCVQANISENPLVRAQIRRFVNSAGRDVANAAVLNAILLPWPSFEEQQNFATIRAGFDERLRDERAELEKLSLLKRGLVEDLLTGRVRVTKILKDAAE